MSSTTPNCQLDPLRKNMPTAANDPTHAKTPISRVGVWVRSAAAPTMSKKMAETMVATVIV